jgi:SAM-dependent methyltransferase
MCSRTMGWKRRLATLANRVLAPLGARLEPVRSVDEPHLFEPGRHAPDAKPWDATFRRWIAEGKASGRDPNELCDRGWGSPLSAAETHYLPHITPASVVLELGPGTGALTRYLLLRCRELILVDYSEVVCRWMDEYLTGKERPFTVHRIDGPTLPMVSSGSIDVVIAHGVFEHVELDDTISFFEEFHRVLKPGGVAAFNFDNIMTEEALELFRRLRPAPGGRCIFRFYHPETLRRLGHAVGFETLRLTVSESRFGYVEFAKPERHRP